MRVIVERDSGIIATALKFQLIVDGEKVEKIKNNETLELELPKDHSIMVVILAVILVPNLIIQGTTLIIGIV